MIDKTDSLNTFKEFHRVNQLIYMCTQIILYYS